MSASTDVADDVKISGSSYVISRMVSWMNEQDLDAFIVPSDDPHLSEYSAECFNRRAFLSGFTGSAGTALITREKALLWTDGRYHLQAEQQLSHDWTLMRAGNPSVPTVKAFIKATLPAKSRVGIDPFVHSAAFVHGLEKDLADADVDVVPVNRLGQDNPVDTIWGSRRPAPPQGRIRSHPLRYAGATVQAKLEQVRQNLSRQDADAMVFCMLDEIAYLFNIRGSDIAHCPVAMAYALITMNEASLFVDQAKLPEDVKADLEVSGVNTFDYEEALSATKSLAEEGQRIWIDPERVTFAFADVVPQQRTVSKTSPIASLKGVKNQVELEGMRAAHIRDGVAMVLALSALDRDVSRGVHVSEVDVDQRITSSRSKQERFLDLSFPTIAGEGCNGAIIHYRAELDSCHFIDRSSMLLLDSGAQYEDGTTDVTRTMHFGEPSTEQKEAYTRVLQGHIALTTTTFPKGTPGFMIDAFARRALWEAGLDYQHGTGHGVGAALNVHEGPHSISSRTKNTTPLEAGMVVSNEPGFYKGGEGGFGVRIENLLEIADSGLSNTPNGRKFFRFEPLTWIPIQKKLIEIDLLSKKEVDWLNSYHEKVLEKIGPLVQDEEASAWLKDATAPIVRP